MDISVVIPEYGCRAAVYELYQRLVTTLESLSLSFEIIFVEDRDPQNSWEEIIKLAEKDQRVKGIHFTRNFGQERAIAAGLNHSKGDYVVVMDCDLQDKPEGIKELYETVRKGYDIVFVKRTERHESAMTRFLSKMFYKVYNIFADDYYDPGIGNFSIASRRAVDAYLSMNETNRAYTMFLKWLGYPSVTIEMPSDERAEGKSSYSFSKKMRYAMEEITSQSNKPLHIAIYIGLTFAFLSFLTILYLVIRHFVDGSVPEGWISLMASIFLIGGLIMSTLGVHGLYVGNIYNEVRNRPLYVVEETRNLEEQ
ncbi:MAG: glycosyltransferase family 2 protein [Solobacterium sp.]|nr:glycosyltransferase family 2 protein [Solobacterium sp.]